MKINHIYHGNALEVLRSLPGESISCTITSPPYWGLRDYGPETITVWDEQPGCVHEWGPEMKIRQRGSVFGENSQTKHTYAKAQGVEIKQGNFCQKCPAWRGALGLEPTFELYIRHLCSIFDEIKRVLRKDGTCWVNLGDSYFGGGRGSDSEGMRGAKKGNGTIESMTSAKPDWNNINHPQKSLCLIPERFVIEMVNRGWIARNKIIWYKRNCMPQSASDRFTVDFEPIFFFTKNPVYYFEQQFEPQSENTHSWYSQDVENGIEPVNEAKQESKELNRPGYNDFRKYTPQTFLPLGRNKRTVWQISAEPTPEAHFATFPQKLVETPIKAGCPEYICTKCGKAREKIFDKTEKINAQWGERKSKPWFNDKREMPQKEIQNVISKFIGYTDCGCRAPYEPGIVLDPFMGAGTTAIVARKLNRNFIGIEMNKQYINIAKSRMSKELGMFA